MSAPQGGARGRAGPVKGAACSNTSPWPGPGGRDGGQRECSECAPASASRSTHAAPCALLLGPWTVGTVGPLEEDAQHASVLGHEARHGGRRAAEHCCSRAASASCRTGAGCNGRAVSHPSRAASHATGATRISRPTAADEGRGEGEGRRRQLFFLAGRPSAPSAGALLGSLGGRSPPSQHQDNVVGKLAAQR
ncbi:hypothetical protein K491DRAFT_680154 [Lophiostoma macrostomum CBS 122681]|uniref:Uncharacterized protein n=1 Tax=Lophiostoma macrostomum CBS 122681 TaxID=1314788 RepID=A0A6A6T5V6_9PLEO|nr:hypothetical protein K491DRAFT_680154 [Lophiostoma macrostomum CBS 122681]